MRNERYHQPVRQHGDTLLDLPPQEPVPQIWYYPPTTCWPSGPPFEQRRNMLGRLVWGVVGFIARIVGVLFRLFGFIAVGVAVLVLLAVLVLAGIKSGTRWFEDHTAPTTTTTAP